MTAHLIHIWKTQTQKTFRTFAVNKPLDFCIGTDGCERPEAVVLHPWTLVLYLLDTAHPFVDLTLAALDRDTAELVLERNVIMVSAKYTGCLVGDGNAFVKEENVRWGSGCNVFAKGKVSER